MFRGKTVGVVVPAYDEEGYVGEVIDTVPEFVDRIYPVDDASTDGTWDEIRERARRQNGRAGPTDRRDRQGQSEEASWSDSDQHDRRDQTEREGSATSKSSPVPDGNGRMASGEAPEDGRTAGGAGTLPGDDPPTDDSPDFSRRVVPIRHEENRGVGAAIKTGYRRAYDDEMDVVAVMAGDGQMDPRLLDRIVAPVVDGRADYAKGNRLHDLDDCESMSDWRLFGNVLLTMLTKASSGYWQMMDPQNGYTAISREALGDLDLESVFDDYGFANAMLVHLNVADSRVADVPMPAQYGDEDSDIRYSTFVPQLSALLAKGMGWRLASKYPPQSLHPLPYLYGIGGLATVGGALGAVRNLLPGRGNGESESSAEDGGPGLGTALAGLLTGALAVSVDAAENEPLHVEASDGEVGNRSEDGRPGDDARPGEVDR